MGHPIRKRTALEIYHIVTRKNGTHRRPRIDGQLGKAIDSNKGVSQGGPLSAHLFAIYSDAVLNDYDNAIPAEVKQMKPDTYERNESEAQNG